MGFLRNSTSGLDKLRRELKEENNKLPKKDRKNRGELEQEVTRRVIRSVRG